MPMEPANMVMFAASLTLLALALGAWILNERQRSFSLKRVNQANHGVPKRGVSERQSSRRLMTEMEPGPRRKRAARRRTLPVSAAEAARFSHAWTTLQCRFVDNPKGVVDEADRLVRELLERHGYFLDDLTDKVEQHEVERRVVSLNDGERHTTENSGTLTPETLVDHPAVVTTYLAAQAITARPGLRSEADTEVLRKAVVYYRILFQELLGVAPGAVAPDVGARVSACSTLSFHV